MPWPDDFIEYITGLPDVTVVSGPEPITIGGVTGTEITVMTPPMHPLVWMDGDYTWLGGGKTGVDPSAERRFAVLETGGHKLLISLVTDPTSFEARNTDLQPILDSITLRVAQTASMARPDRRASTEASPPSGADHHDIDGLVAATDLQVPPLEPNRLVVGGLGCRDSDQDLAGRRSGRQSGRRVHDIAERREVVDGSRRTGRPTYASPVWTPAPIGIGPVGDASGRPQRGARALLQLQSRRSHAVAR